MSEKTPTAPTAKYKLTVKSNTGYNGEQSGNIDPEQYGAACHVLGGHVSPATVMAANDLLAAAKHVLAILDHPTQRVNILDADKLRDAIAKAEGGAA